MGGAISYCFKDSPEKLLQSLISNAKPDYYVESAVLSNEDIEITSRIWTKLMDGEMTSPFTERKCRLSIDFSYESVATWFNDCYRNRFFEVCAEKGHIRTNGTSMSPEKILQRLIAVSFENINDLNDLRHILSDHVKFNHVKGVRLEHYALMGYSLLWTLELVIGKPFDDVMKTAWTKFYSFLLNIILPIAAEYDMKVDHKVHRKSGRISTIQQLFSSENTIKQKLIYQAYPDYFIENPIVTKRDVHLAATSWAYLMAHEKTAPFLDRKAVDADSFEFASSLTWFYDAFYGRLFELSPESELVFAHISMVAQGKLIAALVMSSLDSAACPIKASERLTKIVSKFSHHGLQAQHYSDMGEALFWALELVIGPHFDSPTKLAWIRLYSHILSIILPIAVTFDMKTISKTKQKMNLLKISNNLADKHNNNDNNIDNKNAKLSKLKSFKNIVSQNPAKDTIKRAMKSYGIPTRDSDSNTNQIKPIEDEGLAAECSVKESIVTEITSMEILKKNSRSPNTSINNSYQGQQEQHHHQQHHQHQHQLHHRVSITPLYEQSHSSSTPLYERHISMTPVYAFNEDHNHDEMMVDTPISTKNISGKRNSVYEQLSPRFRQLSILDVQDLERGLRDII
eukprot:gene954-1850_t